jgi:predicted TPR repeat methyltransferase
LTEQILAIPVTLRTLTVANEQSYSNIRQDWRRLVMNSTADRFAEIGAYFDSLVERYGHNYRGLDYGHPQSQIKRFEVLASVCPLDGKRLLDIGCGFADFADFLRSRYDNVRYTGFDISEQMVRNARLLHPDLDIRRENILTATVDAYDVVTANGIFYLLGDNARPTMQKLIDRMFSIATEAVAFSSLSDVAREQVAGEFYASPSDVLAYCQSLTPRVVLRHDYHDCDFTVFMYK